MIGPYIRIFKERNFAENDLDIITSIWRMAINANQIPLENQFNLGKSNYNKIKKKNRKEKEIWKN